MIANEKIPRKYIGADVGFLGSTEGGKFPKPGELRWLGEGWLENFGQE